MFTNVIAGVDGLDGGRDAVALARTLTSGRLTLVGVDRRALLAAREEAAMDAEVVAVGDRSASRGLHRVAEERDADLIVLGSAHHGAIGRLAGDVGRSMLHGSACPVAIAPKRYRSGGKAGALGSIAVGIDGSPESRAALDLAVALAADLHAKLLVLVVWDEPSRLIAAGTATSTELVAIEDEHRARADELLAQTLAVFPDAEGEVVKGRPGPALEAAAEGVDLLVVGSRGWGTARRLALGSTSDWLVHHAPCAVLVVPRPAEGAAEPERAAEERAQTVNLQVETSDIPPQDVMGAPA